MLSLFYLTALFAAFVLASPARRPKDPPTSGFSISARRRTSGKVSSGAELTAKAFAKYNKSTGTNVKVALPASTGTVPASSVQFDQEYLAPIWVGGQMLLLDIDTGSADL